MDIANGELVEQQLTGLIERRHEKRVETEGEREAEALWKASERAHLERRREENRRLWSEYFLRLAVRLRERAADHERRSAALLAENEGRETA